MGLKECIDQIASNGKYFFTQEELLKATNSTEVALRSSLRRLKGKGEIASPIRGYYMLVPPEFRTWGALPPEQFIDDLMRHLEAPYYVGLLSAAYCYGAGVQEQMTLQVVTPRPRRPIKVGKVQIQFITKIHAERSAYRLFNTPRGFVRVAAPETILCDLIAFPQHAGSIQGVFELFSQLGKQIKIKEFTKAVQQVRLAPHLQRLGYFCDSLGLTAHANLCEERLKEEAFVRRVLLDQQGEAMGDFNEKWNLTLNV